MKIKPPLSPGSDIDSYASKIQAVNPLNEEEERELITKHIKGDNKATEQLVTHHLRFVVYLARQFSGYGLPVEDLIQEGNIGLLKALDKFDPKYQVRLSTYAKEWIRAEMHEYVIRNIRPYRIATTKSQRKLFYNIRRFLSSDNKMTFELANKIAKELGVDEGDVFEMHQRLFQYDIEIDAPVGDEDANIIDFMDFNEMATEEIVLNDIQQKRITNDIYNSLDSLPLRTKDIVMRRYLHEQQPTLGQLSEEYGVSIERIRQIEVDGIKKLKNYLAS